jgi:hypothetical protein
MRNLLILPMVCLFMIDLSVDGRIGPGGPTRNAFGIHESSGFPNKPKSVSNYYSIVDIFYDIGRVIYEPIYIHNLLKLFNDHCKLTAYTLTDRSTKYRLPP